MIKIPQKTRLYRSEAWFIFQDGQHIIALRYSRLNSRQDLFINGRRISTRQSHSRHTRHVFTIGKDRYELNLDIENSQMMTARLFKNDQIVSSRALAPRWLLEKLNKRTG